MKSRHKGTNILFSNKTGYFKGRSNKKIGSENE